jgi:hypothetical protein
MSGFIGIRQLESQIDVLRENRAAPQQFNNAFGEEEAMNTRDFLEAVTEEQSNNRREGANAAKFTTSSNRKSFKRRGKSPQQFNGIHRRRSKSIRW